jgi:excisionase family DNA binding protein
VIIIWLCGEKVKAADLSDGDVMDYRGLSRYIKMSYGTLRQKVMKGELPHIKIGRSVRFSKKRIDEWLAKQEREPHGKKSGKGEGNGGGLANAGGSE